MEDIFALLRATGRSSTTCASRSPRASRCTTSRTRSASFRAHDMGGKIALDDFGAGYSSFKYLKALSADALKIDGEFVRTMCAHPADIAIVEAIVAFARNLGMRSVAEWVEDTGYPRALQERWDYVQGFLVARPQESTAILAASSAAAFVRDPGERRVSSRAFRTRTAVAPRTASELRMVLRSARPRVPLGAPVIHPGPGRNAPPVLSEAQSRRESSRPRSECACSFHCARRPLHFLRREIAGVSCGSATLGESTT